MKRANTKNPRKQRALLLRASLNRNKKTIAAPLSEDLRKRYKIRRLPVRRDDVVHIRTGTFQGTEGRVTNVHLKKQRLEIDGITREKMDGSKIFYPIHPSNVVIIRLGRLDSYRKKSIERKAKEEIEFPKEEVVEEEVIEEELDEEDLDELEIDTEVQEDLEEEEKDVASENVVRSPLPRKEKED